MVAHFKPMRRPLRILAIDWAAQPLGRDADSVIARRLGVCWITVKRERERRGIPPVHKRINWDQQPLGQMSDTVLAEQLGVMVSTVCSARKRRGIPCWIGPKRPPGSRAYKPPPSASPALRASIEDALGYYEGRTFQEVAQAVRDDFGAITDRGVHRGLEWLRVHGRLRRVQVDPKGSGYTHFLYYRTTRAIAPRGEELAECVK